MGFVANDEELQLGQRRSDDAGFLTIPTTPENTPMDTTSDSAGERMGLAEETSASEPRISQPEHQESAARHMDVDENYSDEDKGDPSGEEPYASLDPKTILAIPVTNPSAFPIERLREVQEGRQPSTHITNMLVHKKPSGPIIQITADIQDGSINHLFIRDPRVINALGLAAPDFDTINLDLTGLRLDETFTIKVFSGQQPQKLENWVMGELVSARHAYLYWLDERQSADPRGAPFAAEARVIARKMGRRWTDVMQEIEGVWKLELGRGGAEYRENRARYLGEDPTYQEGTEGGRAVRSMFG